MATRTQNGDAGRTVAGQPARVSPLWSSWAMAVGRRSDRGRGFVELAVDGVEELRDDVRVIDGCTADG